MLAGTHSEKFRKPKVVQDQEGFDRMIHPLSVCDSLRIESSNHIYFSCQYYDNRQIKLQEQFQDQDGQTNFIDIFKIKIWEITLRELLILQSFYTCEKVSDVEQLVNNQPNPKLFFKVFLELSIQNMIPYLSFDARSIRHLLDNEEKNNEYYSEDFPLFYLTNGRSAIDYALENNLLRSVSLMIEYIVRY